jgi:hypothetical protein
VRIDGTWHAPRHPALYVQQVSQCGDAFPKEKIHFCFNHLRDLPTGLRSRKAGGLEYCEIHNIQEKEFQSTDQ